MTFNIKKSVFENNYSDFFFPSSGHAGEKFSFFIFFYGHFFMWKFFLLNHSANPFSQHNWHLGIKNTYVSNSSSISRIDVLEPYTQLLSYLNTKKKVGTVLNKRMLRMSTLGNTTQLSTNSTNMSSPDQDVVFEVKSR